MPPINRIPSPEENLNLTHDISNFKEKLQASIRERLDVLERIFEEKNISIEDRERYIKQFLEKIKEAKDDKDVFGSYEEIRQDIYDAIRKTPTEISGKIDSEKKDSFEEHTPGELKNQTPPNFESKEERERAQKLVEKKELTLINLKNDLAKIKKKKDRESRQQRINKLEEEINEINARLGVKEATPPVIPAETIVPVQEQANPAEASPEKVPTNVEPEIAPINIEPEIIPAPGMPIEKTPEEIKIENLEEKFKFLNISLNDLESVEGYNSLSYGQKILLADNLKQLVLGRIQNEALGEYKEKVGQEKLLKRIWLGISKKFQIAKSEKNKAEEISKGGIDLHGPILKQLVNGLREFGPEVEEIDEKLEIKYLSEKDFSSELNFLSPEEKDIVKTFNHSAEKFSKIPDEWRYHTASKSDQAKFMAAKKEYETALAGIAPIIRRERSEDYTVAALQELDKKVAFNQFLNTNPEAEKILANIKDKNVLSTFLKSLIKSSASMNGLFFAGGAVVRSFTVGALGFVGAPLAAGIIGGLRARHRAKENIKETEIQGRKKEDKTLDGLINQRSEIILEISRLVPEEFRVNPMIWYRGKGMTSIEKEPGEQGINSTKKFKSIGTILDDGQKATDEQKATYDQLKKELAEVDSKINEIREKSIERNYLKAEDATEKIDDLIKRIWGNNEVAERNKLLISLNQRIIFTENKLNEGLINFGTQDKSLFNYCELIKKISEAKTVQFIFENNFSANEEDEKLKLNNRLKKFLDFQDKNISEKHKKHIRNSIIKGASISATFATAGYLARHFMGITSGHENWSGQKITPESETGGEISSTEKIAMGMKRLKDFENKYGIKVENQKDITGDYKIDTADIARIQADQLGKDTPFTEPLAKADFENLENEKGTEIATKILERSQPSETDLDVLGAKELPKNIRLGLLNDSDGQAENLRDILAINNSDPNIIQRLDSLTEGREINRIVKVPEGGNISQALDVAMTQDAVVHVINPDGSAIMGDANIVHPGDTLVETDDGGIYVLKTSEITVGEKTTLTGLYDKIEADLNSQKVPLKVQNAFNTNRDEIGWLGRIDKHEAKAASEFWKQYGERIQKLAPEQQGKFYENANLHDPKSIENNLDNLEKEIGNTVPEETNADIREPENISQPEEIPEKPEAPTSERIAEVKPSPVETAKPEEIPQETPTKVEIEKTDKPELSKEAQDIIKKPIGEMTQTEKMKLVQEGEQIYANKMAQLMPEEAQASGRTHDEIVDFFKDKKPQEGYFDQTKQEAINKNIKFESYMGTTSHTDQNLVNEIDYYNKNVIAHNNTLAESSTLSRGLIDFDHNPAAQEALDSFKETETNKENFINTPLSDDKSVSSYEDLQKLGEEINNQDLARLYRALEMDQRSLAEQMKDSFGGKDIFDKKGEFKKEFTEFVSKNERAKSLFDEYHSKNEAASEYERLILLHNQQENERIDLMNSAKRILETAEKGDTWHLTQEFIRENFTENKEIKKNFAGITKEIFKNDNKNMQELCFNRLIAQNKPVISYYLEETKKGNGEKALEIINNYFRLGLRQNPLVKSGLPSMRATVLDTWTSQNVFNPNNAELLKVK